MSVIYVGSPALGASYSVSITDADGSLLSSANVDTTVAPKIPLNDLLGGYLVDLNGNYLTNNSPVSKFTISSPFNIEWPGPVMFDRMAVNVNVLAAAGVRLAGIHIPVSEEEYTVLGPLS
jgi:hypothetical protein